MGTYKSIRITADTEDPDIIAAIFVVLKAYAAEDCWQKFCEETKWWPDEVMNVLTNDFPKVMFRVDYDGIQSESVYWLGGKFIPEGWVNLEKFPSRTKFKASLEAGLTEMVNRKAREKAEADRLAALVEKAKEIAEREQLKVLKKKYG